MSNWHDLLPHGYSTSLANTVKKFLRDSWNFFDQTFLGLGLGTSFPTKETLVNDIPAEDGIIAKLFFTVSSPKLNITWGQSSVELEEFQDGGLHAAGEDEAEHTQQRAAPCHQLSAL